MPNVCQTSPEVTWTQTRWSAGTRSVLVDSIPLSYSKNHANPSPVTSTSSASCWPPSSALGSSTYRSIVYVQITSEMTMTALMPNERNSFFPPFPPVGNSPSDGRSLSSSAVSLSRYLYALYKVYATTMMPTSVPSPRNTVKILSNTSTRVCCI